MTDEFPPGFVWDEAEGRPVFKGRDARDGEAVLAGLRDPSTTGVPHLERAVELLWEAGHPRVAEALRDEVVTLLAMALLASGQQARGE